MYLKHAIKSMMVRINDMLKDFNLHCRWTENITKSILITRN